MDLKILQKFDAAGYHCGQCYFQVMDGVFPPNNTTETPLPDGADNKQFFYKWSGTEWLAEKKPTTAQELIGVKVSHQSMTPHDIELRQIIQNLAKEEGYRLRPRNEDLSWEIEEIPQKTEEELQQEAADEVRRKRDQLISETDYLLMSDYPIDSETLELVKAYRQKLRDIPQQEGFPSEVAWPETPQVIAEL